MDSTRRFYGKGLSEWLEVGRYVVGERDGQRSWYFRLFLSIPLFVFCCYGG
jgi:hypothetical protein